MSIETKRTPQLVGERRVSTLAAIQASKAQQLLDTLTRAVQNGAIGATYEKGQIVVYPNIVVDKDHFGIMVNQHEARLKEAGINKRDRMETSQKLMSRFHEGSPLEQHILFTNLLDSLSLLGNKKTK